MAAMWLELFGGVRLMRQGSRVALATRKAQAVLAYLALNPDQPRSRLSTLFWCDSAEPQARESLRQTLSQLRRAFGPDQEQAMLSGGETLALDRSLVAVDIIEFDKLRGGNKARELQQAVELYRGEFLAGMDLRAPEFEGWLVAQREHYRNAMHQTLAKLLTLHRAAADYENEMAVASRMVALDPLDEQAHRSLMESYRRQGRHSLALRQYRVCAEALQRELNVEPDAATKSLWQKISGERRNPIRERAAAALDAIEQEPAPIPPRHLETSPESTRRQADERRQLSVLCCELPGWVAFSVQSDPEEFGAVIAGYEARCNAVVRAFGGKLRKAHDGRWLAYFGFPVARENCTEQAVRCALELADLMLSYAGVSSRPRIAIASGPVVVCGTLQDAGSVIGDAPNLAARLQAVAKPGEVIVSATTRELVGGLFHCEELGPVDLVDYPGPVPAWRAVASNVSEGRFKALHEPCLAEFVGRAEEIELLLKRWRQCETKEGRVVLISGEAGIGKSRLMWEFGKQLASQPSQLSLFCSPYHADSPLYPISQQLQKLTEMSLKDSLEDKLGKIERFTRNCLETVSDHVPILAELLSLPATGRYPRMELSPQVQKARILAVLLEIVAGFASKKPILVAFEDVQWIDPTSREFLDRLVEQAAELPILLIVTCRPQFAPAWIDQPHVSVCVLGRLQRRDAEVLVDSVAGTKALSGPARNSILFRADGVPLFIEELTKSVLETGAHEIASTEMHQQLPIPATLHDSLMARLDRLNEGRELARLAAAIGRQFSFELIRAVAQLPDQKLEEGLQELVDAQLVYCTGTPPDAEYVFKHALVQDVAYQSQLRSHRAATHRKIATTMIERFPNFAESQPEVIAMHLNASDQSAAAIPWWTRAGTRSLRRSAFIEATAHFEKAISLADGPAFGSMAKLDRLELQIAYGQAMISARGHAAAETTKAFSRARDLVADIETSIERCSVNYGLWVGSYLRGESGPMADLANSFQREARSGAEPGQACLAHRVNGVTLWWQGNYREGRDQFERAVAAYDFDNQHLLAFRFGQDPGVCAHTYLAMVLWPMGEASKAYELLREAVRLAERGGHLPTRAWLHCHQCLFEAARDNPDRARLDAEALLMLGSQHELPLWIAYGTFFQGWCSWQSGRSPSALAEMRRGIELLHRQRIAAFLPLLRALQARAEAEFGDVATGLAIIEDSLSELRRTGDRRYEADLHCHRAALLDLRGPKFHREAEASLRFALSTACAQGTRSFELRAASGLADILMRRGRRGEARKLLSKLKSAKAIDERNKQVVEALK